MAVWLVRAGRVGEDEAQAFEKGLAIIGWKEMPEVSSVASYEEMKREHGKYNPDLKPRSNTNQAAQLWTFVKRIKNGDMVVLPLKTRSVIAIGKVAGDYQYLNGRVPRKARKREAYWHRHPRKQAKPEG